MDVCGFGDGEGEGEFGGVNGDVVAMADGAVEDFDDERVLNEALDGALEGARSVGPVVAGFQDARRARRRAAGSVCR